MNNQLFEYCKRRNDIDGFDMNGIKLSVIKGMLEFYMQKLEYLTLITI